MSGKVLHLLSQRPLLTGSGITLDALVSRAARAGWRQHVVFGTPADEVPDTVGGLDRSDLSPLRFETDALPIAVPGMSDTMPYRSRVFSSLDNSELVTYRDAWREHLAEVVSAFEPDIVHGHHLWILGSMLRDTAGDIPIVLHSHGTALRQLDLCKHLAVEVIAGCGRADRFLALHRQHARSIVGRYGVPEQWVEVVGAGYREDLFHTRGREPVTGRIVYAGKLARAKGVPWLLDAFERLRGDRDVELHIAGGGGNDEARVIGERAERTDGVVVHGRLSQVELAELLRTAQVFVLPSMYEGLPLVLVEALASGCRLVATALPGVQELAPALGERLITVAPPRRVGPDEPVAADLPAFIAALSAALGDAIDAGLAAAPDREHTAPLSWDAVYGRVERIWRELLGLGSGSRLT